MIESVATANFGFHQSVTMPKQLNTPGFSSSKKFSFAGADEEDPDNTKMLHDNQSNSSGDMSVSSINSDTFKFGVSVKTFREQIKRQDSEVSLPETGSDSSCELNMVRRGSNASNVFGLLPSPVPSASKET